MDWDTLQTSCLACRRCGLHEKRTNVVFGIGRRDAEVLFVGEGPGEQEDLRGEPFVGRAGKLLDNMLLTIGLNRSMIYIANIVKCRPPGNRDPLPEEAETCIGWLREQFRIINPKIIVCLGRIAAMRLIRPDFRISAEHGRWFDKKGVRFMALYHPAALLRNPNLKPDTFEDLKRLESEIRSVCTHTYENGSKKQ